MKSTRTASLQNTFTMNAITNPIYRHGTTLAMLLSVSAHAVPVNIALNPAGTGFPSPIETDVGYNNFSVGPWYLLDGTTVQQTQQVTGKA